MSVKLATVCVGYKCLDRTRDGVSKRYQSRFTCSDLGNESAL